MDALMLVALLQHSVHSKFMLAVSLAVYLYPLFPADTVVYRRRYLGDASLRCPGRSLLKPRCYKLLIVSFR